MSHTVNYTMHDLTVHWPGNKNRLVLLKDGCSAVPGYEAVAETFMSMISDAGVQLHTCKSVFDDVLGITEGIYDKRLEKPRHCIPLLRGVHDKTLAEELYPMTMKLLSGSIMFPVKSVRTTRQAVTGLTGHTTLAPESNGVVLSTSASNPGFTVPRNASGSGASRDALPPVRGRKVYKVAVSNIESGSNSESKS
jgi:hypothetical protein